MGRLSPLLRLPHRPYLRYTHPAEQFDDRLHIGLLPGAARGFTGLAPLPLPTHLRVAGGDVVQEVLLRETPAAVDLQPDEIRVLRIREEDCSRPWERDWVPTVRYGKTEDPAPQPAAGDLRADPAVAVRRRGAVAGIVAAEVQIHKHSLLFCTRT
jgi:hypothetical protein